MLLPAALPGRPNAAYPKACRQVSWRPRPSLLLPPPLVLCISIATSQGGILLPLAFPPISLAPSHFWGPHRFVSLLPFQPRASVGEQRAQTWNSPHTFLAAGRGDVSDHALLLCSLLLGFGLDAFLCCGWAHPDGSSSSYSSEDQAAERGFNGHQGVDSTGPGEETGHMVREQSRADRHTN